MTLRKRPKAMAKDKRARETAIELAGALSNTVVSALVRLHRHNGPNAKMRTRLLRMGLVTHVAASRCQTTPLADAVLRARQS
jgi:hypothetical protein